MFTGSLWSLQNWLSGLLSLLLQEGDPDTIVGGPGIAYNINTDRNLHPTAQRPNGGDMMVGAALSGMQVDFFSFHVVNPCLYEPVCNVTWVGSSLGGLK